MAMADFQQAYRRMLAHEGGYANHPADRGGETYRGIARRFHPSWKGWTVIDQLKKEPGFPRNLANHASLQEMVGTLYLEQFWQPLKAEKILQQSIADQLFDAAVNMGISTAVRFAQTALNLLSHDQASPLALKVDGRMGPKTLQAINAHPEPEVLLQTLCSLRLARYIDICQQNPSQEVFLRGWLKRTTT